LGITACEDILYRKQTEQRRQRHGGKTVIINCKDKEAKIRSNRAIIFHIQQWIEQMIKLVDRVSKYATYILVTKMGV
jgi:hypothetical protein